jgi:hypothetical protein
MILNEDTFLLFAAKNYDMKRAVSSEEFYDDLKRIQYLKRLFKRYDDTGELKVRLILNHLIVLYNCFGPFATNMLFFKLKEYHKYLKPFVTFLNFMPDVVEYENNILISRDIPYNENILSELEKL